MTPSFKSPRVEDIKELQELVADHVGTVEPGLRLLDSGVRLGGSTVDVLAVDAAGVLTLIVLSRQADDGTMLRGLEAYSWCVEHPDALRRLYPAARLSSTQPPRVLFIAEQIAEAFLRKLRHLRFHRVDCLEVRFGLQFAVVGKGQGTGGAPPAAPLPRAGRAEPPRAASTSRRGGPAARPEAPAPRGRREPPARPRAYPRGEPAGERPADPAAASELDESKLRVVREYLQREFPTTVIYDFFAYEDGVQMFHLQNDAGTIVHVAAVAADALAGLDESAVSHFLEDYQLARLLRDAGAAGVTVTKAGPETAQP